MDTRKIGLKGLSKKEIHGIGLSAGCCAVFAVLSLFIEFEDIKNQNAVPTLFFILSLFLLGIFLFALSILEDSSKMVLEFHPPKTAHRESIRSTCENICKNYSKKYKLLYVIVFPLVLGFMCFEICSAVVPLGYLMDNAMRLFTNYFLLPALLAGFFAFFIWDMIYRNRLEEIQSGAYAIAEISFAEKYYCISSGKTSQSVRTSYFVILEDSHGNKGRFKVCESEYYRFHADNTILLVKRSKGKLFYNAMEPVVILEPYCPTLDF